MNYISMAATIFVVAAIGIVAAGIIVSVMEVLRDFSVAVPQCDDMPPSAQEVPCKAIREARAIVYACWSEGEVL